MLLLNQQRRWMPVPETEIILLLSPLTVTERQKLAERCTVTEGTGKKARTRFDLPAYNAAVAEQCLHDWKGVGHKLSDDQVVAIACTPESRQALMTIDPIAAFVLNTVQGLGIHLQEAEAEAGKDSAGAPAG